MSTDGKARPRIEVPFYPVPAEIAAKPGLSPRAKLLFGVIWSLSMTSRGCVSSISSLARRVDISPRQVMRLVDKLVEHGLVARRRSEEDGRATEITVNLEARPVKIRDKDVTKCSGGKKVTKPSCTHDKDVTKCSDKNVTNLGDKNVTDALYRENSNLLAPTGPEKIAQIEADPAAGPDGPPARGGEGEGDPILPWRQYAFGFESPADVIACAAAAGYAVGLREGGAVIDIAPADGAAPTNRHRREMTEFGRRIRAAQRMAALRDDADQTSVPS